MSGQEPPQFTFLPGLPPRPFDVVWCRWPAKHSPLTGFKVRPGLVRTTFKRGPHFAVEVAYGSSQVNKDYISSIWIANVESMDAAGLYQQTRFELDQTLTLPWAEEFFVPRPGEPTPIIGRLSNVDIARIESFIQILRRFRGR